MLILNILRGGVCCTWWSVVIHLLHYTHHMRSGPVIYLLVYDDIYIFSDSETHGYVGGKKTMSGVIKSAQTCHSTTSTKK